MKQTVVAIIQKPPVILDLAASIDRAVSYIDESSAGGANLVVFPETWLTCYPAWAFGLAGWGDITGRYWHGRLLTESPSLEDDDLRSIREAAARNRVNVVLGLNERHGRTLYNSAITFGTNGEILNVHRKLVPTHTERIIWAAGDAAGLVASDTPAGRLGTLICWEHWMPLARQTLHADNEDIHVSLWPDTPEIHQIAARSYAFEGRCFVVSAGLYLHTSDVPSDLLEFYRQGVGPSAPEEGILFDGGSSIIDPLGQWMVGPVRNENTIVFGTLDFTMLNEARHDFDVTGHSARHDVFELTVNNRRPRPVVRRPERDAQEL